LKNFKLAILIIQLAVALNVGFSQEKGVISGELKMWHKVTLTFDGSEASESGNPNVFMNYRLDVTFTHPASNTTLVVPGYWAADGDAANTSGEEGNVWRVHLSPSATGTWNYSVSFLQGNDVHMNKSAGTSAAFMDGETGTFEIGATDKVHPDTRSKGWLQWVGGHYPQFKGNGEYMLKVGVDGPETLLQYKDFDGQEDRHDYSPHETDWKEGDPAWAGGKGKGLIGMINYLASEEQNAFGCILNQAPNGDANGDAHPYVEKNDLTRLDVSKITQWGIVFDHGTKMGLFWHFKMTETENECAMDNCEVGRERQMFFREMIARFGHIPAMNWNLGEENGALTKPPGDQNSEQRRAMAKYFWDNDPYRHLIVLHNGRKPDDMYGDQSLLTGWSYQKSTFTECPVGVRDIVNTSAERGRPWAVSPDECGGGSGGIKKDSDGPAHDLGRKYMVWGTFMVGGWGAEMYLRNDDWYCNEFHSRDKWWDYARYALKFWKDNNIPFWQMKNMDDLSSNNNSWVFAKEGEVYVIYLKEGGSADLDVGGSAVDLDVKWYDPRAGGALQDGSVIKITGTGNQSIGNPPSEAGQDWAVLVGGNNIVGLDKSQIQANDLISPKFTYNLSTGNKVNGVITNLPSGRKAEVTVMNIQGKSIMRQSFTEFSKEGLQFTWDTSISPSGLYFVSVVVGDVSYGYKMMLEK